MSRGRLTRRERRELREISKRISAESPGLSRGLSDSPPGLSPDDTRRLMHAALACGTVLLVVGMWLGVGSSVLGGLAFLGVGALLYRIRMPKPQPIRRTGAAPSDGYGPRPD